MTRLLHRESYPLNRAVLIEALKHLKKCAAKSNLKNIQTRWAQEALQLGLHRHDFKEFNAKAETCPRLNESGEADLMSCIALSQRSLEGPECPEAKQAKTNIDRLAGTAKRLLVEANEGLANRVATRFTKQARRENVDIETLRELAQEALKQAAETNDYNIFKHVGRDIRHLRFSTWAYKYIKWFLAEALAPFNNKSQWLIDYSSPYLNAVFRLKSQMGKIRKQAKAETNNNEDFMLRCQTIVRNRLVMQFPELTDDIKMLNDLTTMVLDKKSYPRSYIKTTAIDLDANHLTPVSRLFEADPKSIELDRKWLRDILEDEQPILQGSKVKNPLSSLERRVLLHRYAKDRVNTIEEVAEQLSLSKRAISRISQEAMAKLENWQELQTAFREYKMVPMAGLEPAREQAPNRF